MTRIYPLIFMNLLFGTVACTTTSVDESGGLVVYDGPGGISDGAIRPNRPVMRGEISPVYGFVSPEHRVEYYYFGEVDRIGPTVPVNPIYFFYDQNGQPLFRLSENNQKLVGWHPIINVVPTKHGYSPFWRVHKVHVKGNVDAEKLAALQTVPAKIDSCQMDAICSGGKRCIENRCTVPINVGNYALDSIKSLKTLTASGLTITASETVLNCPVVDANATLIKGVTNPDTPFPKVQLWYKRLEAYCFLAAGSKELFDNGPSGVVLGADNQPLVANAYFINRTLTFGQNTGAPVIPKRNLVLTDKLPGDPGYSPLVKEWRVEVDKDHTFKDLRAVAEAQQMAQAKGLPITATENLHNLVVRGTSPRCITNDDCAGTGGKVDPPLKCSPETGYCAPPFARFHEECRPGVKECDPAGGPEGSRLVCLRLRIREKLFCHNTCDSTEKDDNPDPEIDSRCGSIHNTRCFTLRRSNPNAANGVCVQRCNSRLSGPETPLGQPCSGKEDCSRKQCGSPSCGNGTLDIGEACDDGNLLNGDGCNEFCSLSTYERCDKESDCRGALQACAEIVDGQSNKYCTPPQKAEKDEREDKDIYRPTCVEIDWCWPPDERADWLGEEEQS